MKKTATDGDKAKLPTDPKAFAALDTRLGQEMAKCAAQYDTARADLAKHHGKMQTQEAALLKQVAALQPQVDGLMDGTGPGLTKAVAQACLRYMDLLAQVQKVRQGTRLAYGATVPPGEQRLGGAMGDPLPNMAPADMSDSTYDGSGVQQKRRTTKSLLKGVRVAVLMKAVRGLHPYETAARQIHHASHSLDSAAFILSDGSLVGKSHGTPEHKYHGEVSGEAIHAATGENVPAGLSPTHFISHTGAIRVCNPGSAFDIGLEMGRPPTSAQMATLHTHAAGQSVGMEATNGHADHSKKTLAWHTAPAFHTGQLQSFAHKAYGSDTTKAIMGHGIGYQGGSASYMSEKPRPAAGMAAPAFKTPVFKTPFKMPKVAVHFSNAFGGSKAPTESPLPKIKTPAASAAPPANHFDSAGAAGSVGGQLHEVKSRTVKPLFGKAREEHAHLMSHSSPKLAAHDLHAQMASQGHTVGPIHEQRVPHADGGMAHLYSFDHHDEHGVKHTIHMIRSVRQARGSGGSRRQAASAPTKSVPKRVAVKAPSRTPAARPATGKDFDPGMSMTHEAFTPAFIQHHAKAGTLPDKPETRDKMLKTAYKKHQAQYPHSGH